jgi:hypothetical protein
MTAALPLSLIERHAKASSAVRRWATGRLCVNVELIVSGFRKFDSDNKRLLHKIKVCGKFTTAIKDKSLSRVARRMSAIIDATGTGCRGRI